MVSTKQNLEIWDNPEHWDRGSLGDGVGLEDGEKWSRSWGSSRAQWQVTIEPRIRELLSKDCILELAPGRGRWTAYLVDLCRSLVIVDLSATCIDYCRNKFRAYEHVTYIVNDGKTLAEVPSESVAFLFSFDSLVHVEEPEMASYIEEMARVLKPGGTAFIHHSNLGEYAGGISSNTHMRAATVSAGTVSTIADEVGLAVIHQELIPWSADNLEEGVFVDAFSTLRKGGEPRGSTPIRNARFLEEHGAGIRLTNHSQTES